MDLHKFSRGPAGGRGVEKKRVNIVRKLIGEAGAQLKIKLEENKKQAQRGHYKLRGSVFSLRQRTKTEGKYFTIPENYNFFLIIRENNYTLSIIRKNYSHLPKLQLYQILSI